MRSTLRLIVILFGALAALPMNAQAQQLGTAGDIPESLPSGWLMASAASPSVASGSVAPFTLTSVILAPDRGVVDCVSGPRCVFFPDSRGHQTVASQFSVSGIFDEDPQKPSSSPSAPVGAIDARPDPPASDATKPGSSGNMPLKDPGFAWGSALVQSLLFLGIEHGFRIAFDPPTRHAMVGPFWNDYIASVKSTKTWGDNNKGFVNYLGHPMQGGITGFIQIQNDPKGRNLGFGFSHDYWISRMKAMAWSAAYSTFFEIGFPISEAAVGNLGVGRHPDSPKMGYVDLVITPTLGTVWVIAEDVVDTYLVRRIEGKTQNQTVRALARGLLNPMRSVSNVMRFKHPWYRDDPRR
jgi:hypothetical protein